MLSYVYMKLLEGRPRSYDRRMDRASGGRVTVAKELVASLVPEGARVLEIGCGTGQLATMLAAKGATVRGFDPSRGMIEEARERARREGVEERVRVEQIGVEELDRFPEGSFDVVVSTLVFSELSTEERGYSRAIAKSSLGATNAL